MQADRTKSPRRKASGAGEKKRTALPVFHARACDAPPDTEREAPDLEQRPEKEWTEEQCMDITSFAADGKGGFLAVKKGKILSDYVEEDMIYYDPQLEIERDRGTDVVEVWIEDGCYFYLKADGNVFGNGTVSESVYNREIVSEEK